MPTSKQTEEYFNQLEDWHAAADRNRARAALNRRNVIYEDQRVRENEFWDGRDEPYVDPRDAKIERLESIIKKYCLLTNKELEDL
ncbi:MAG: hypothetical protein K0U41_06725 [Gammaproteobacteria bacterium]|nr:hypothetical protein [Gammaproteobacteria bacterium]